MDTATLDSVRSLSEPEEGVEACSHNIPEAEAGSSRPAHSTKHGPGQPTLMRLWLWDVRGDREREREGTLSEEHH